MCALMLSFWVCPIDVFVKLFQSNEIKTNACGSGGGKCDGKCSRRTGVANILLCYILNSKWIKTNNCIHLHKIPHNDKMEKCF